MSSKALTLYNESMQLKTPPDITTLRETQIARFMGPTWGPSGSCRPYVGPMNLAIRELVPKQ